MEIAAAKAPKRTRRTHFTNFEDITDPLEVPSTMRQAFFMLALLAGRRNDEQIAAMPTPEVEVYLEQLEKKWSEVEQEWRELHTFVQSEAMLAIVGQEYARNAEIYMQLKGKLRTRMCLAPPMGWTQATGSSSMAIGATGQTIQIQMPEPVNVPKFSGKDEDWARFRAAFIAEVHNNGRLNNAQKLRHLLSAIEGRARDILGQWSPNQGESYEQAWKSLCHAYDNEYNTVKAHLRRIDDLRPVQRPTCATIRQVLDTVRSAHRQLQVLLTTDQVTEHLLMHRIEGLLDSESLSQWALRRLPMQLPTLAGLYEYLEMRASTLWAMTGQSGRSAEQHPRTSTPAAVAAPATPALGRTDERRPDCTLCPGERHWPFKCTKFKALPLTARLAHVDKLRMCRNCFSLRHQASQCPDKKCPRCREPHNSCLCPANVKIENTQSANRRAITAPETGAAANTTTTQQ